MLSSISKWITIKATSLGMLYIVKCISVRPRVQKGRWIRFHIPNYEIYRMVYLVRIDEPRLHWNKSLFYNARGKYVDLPILYNSYRPLAQLNRAQVF